MKNRILILLLIVQNLAFSQGIFDKIYETGDSLFSLNLQNRFSINDAYLKSIDTLIGYEVVLYKVTNNNCMQLRFFVDDFEQYNIEIPFIQFLSDNNKVCYSYVIFQAMDILASDLSEDANTINKLYTNRPKFYEISNCDTFYKTPNGYLMQVWNIEVIAYNFHGPAKYAKYFQMFSHEKVKHKSDVFLQYIYKQVLNREPYVIKNHPNPKIIKDFDCRLKTHD